MKRIILLISLGCFVLNMFGQEFMKPIDTLNFPSTRGYIYNLNQLPTGDFQINVATTFTSKLPAYVVDGNSGIVSGYDDDSGIFRLFHQLDDGTYLVVKAINIIGNFGDLVVQKYSSQSELLWQTELGRVQNYFLTKSANGMYILDDGILIYGGLVEGSGMFKVNFDGSIVWDLVLENESGFTLLEDHIAGNYYNPINLELVRIAESDTLTFVSDDRVLTIDNDGAILSDEAFKEFETFDIDFTSIIDHYISRRYFGWTQDEEAEYSLVRIAAVKESNNLVLASENYAVKFDKNTREIIWRTYLGDDAFLAAFELLPNGNLLYLPSRTISDAKIVDSSSGEILQSVQLLLDGENCLIDEVFIEDTYFSIVGSANSFGSNHNFIILNSDFDLNVVSGTLNHISRKAVDHIIKNVEKTDDGGFAGVVSFNNDDLLSELFVFRADSTGRIFTNELSGNVFGDLNNNCDIDLDDVSLADWDVIARGDQSFCVSTNEDGEYKIQIDTGVYEVSVIPKNDYWLICDTLEVEIPNFLDTITNIDLTASAITPCSFIEVDVGFGFLRRCFSNRVVVQYCNQGTFVEEEAMIELNIDSFLDVDTTSIPISSQQDTTLFFDIGEVGIGECGKFDIWVTPNCDNTILGQEHCINAHVFPDTLCVPQDSLWSGANVVVDAICEGDSTLFKITNLGNGPTKDDLAYIVIVDDIIVSRGDTYSLEAGESIEFVEYEPGSSVKVIAEQEPFHPLGNQVGAEAFCAGTDFDFISSFNQFDDDPFTDIVCAENRGSFDPNDKSAIPVGAGPEHDISASQDLEYKIRFQNTGTDTAFTVVIRDTITSELDITTFQAGIGSHDYTVAIEQGNILIFTFDNILLPDSTTNLIESNGFVEFKINQVDSNLPDTRIENTAAIFFDFNDPIITNTVFHTIETPVTFSMTSVDLCANEMYDQVFYPNDTTISVLHASPLLDSFAIVNIHSFPVDSTFQHLNVEYGTTINEALITVDTTIYERYTNSVGCDSILVQNITVENTTSISLVDKGYWEVFPNPTKGSLTIATSQSFTDDRYTVNVMNIVGVSVYEQDHKISPNENLSLDLRNLSAGTYLLSIASKHGMIIEKIVINP